MAGCSQNGFRAIVDGFEPPHFIRERVGVLVNSFVEGPFMVIRNLALSPSRFSSSFEKKKKKNRTQIVEADIGDQ